MTPLEQASKFCEQAKWNQDVIPELAGLLARVISFEREECAKIADNWMGASLNAGNAIAAAIRGRTP